MKRGEVSRIGGARRREGSRVEELRADGKRGVERSQGVSCRWFCQAELRPSGGVVVSSVKLAVCCLVSSRTTSGQKPLTSHHRQEALCLNELPDVLTSFTCHVTLVSSCIFFLLSALCWALMFFVKESCFQLIRHFSVQ